METENQREGYGRSRGKYSKKKEREKQEREKQEQKEKQKREQQRQQGFGKQQQQQEPLEPRKLRGKSDTGKKAAMIAGGVVLAVAVAAGAVYAGMGQKYRQVYFPNTTINGLDVSGMTPEETKQLITDGTSGYTLTIQERGGLSETITGSEIGLHPEFDGTLEQILENQNTLAWGFHIGRYVAYTIDTMAAFDETKLSDAVNALNCLKPEQAQAPQNAYISDYISGTGYEIVPEEQGASPDPQLLYEALQNGIINFQEAVSLEDADVYEKPQITSEDEALNAELAAWNQYVHTTVTYRFGSKSEVLDGEKIHTWLVSDGQGGVTIDQSKISEYVSWLAQTYNTAYKAKTLKTSYGQTVTISKSVYGWKINQSEETAALTQILLSCESQEREPVYSQTAASHDGNDYGNTYAEINLTAQHMFFYKEGKLVVESDFVSGNESRGWSTPAGVYPLTYKQRNATLKGANYSTPVSYWMPFNGGIGMHDAKWRSSFGGTIYKTNGSHGCINLPPAVAKTIFENISAGTPVLCYHLDGSGSGKTSTSAQNTAAETTAQQNTESGQSAAHESQAAQTSQATHASTAAQQQATAAAKPQATSAAQPQSTTAAQPQTSAAAQPTTAAAQPGTPAQSTTAAAAPGSAQAYPGQGSSEQNTSSAGPGSGSGSVQSAPGNFGNTAGPGA